MSFKQDCQVHPFLAHSVNSPYLVVCSVQPPLKWTCSRRSTARILLLCIVLERQSLFIIEGGPHSIVCWWEVWSRVRVLILAFIILPNILHIVMTPLDIIISYNVVSLAEFVIRENYRTQRSGSQGCLLRNLFANNFLKVLAMDRIRILKRLSRHGRLVKVQNVS